MTRDELEAAIGEVLDTPRTVPGRLDTIMLAVDRYAAEAEAAAFDHGYASRLDGFHDQMADRISKGEV